MKKYLLVLVTVLLLVSTFIASLQKNLLLRVQKLYLQPTGLKLTFQ